MRSTTRQIRRGHNSMETAYRILQNAANAKASIIVLIPKPDGMNDPVYIDGNVPFHVALAWIDAAVRARLRLAAVQYDAETDLYRAWSISRDGRFKVVTSKECRKLTRETPQEFTGTTDSDFLGSRVAEWPKS